MFQWLLDYWGEGSHADDIIVNVIVFLLGLFITGTLKVLSFVFNWLRKTFILPMKNMIVSKMEQMKEDRDYKKTIKQIENQEIGIPKDFLIGKSPEKNPELKKIFQMIEDGVIETPESYKLLKMFKDMPNLNISKDDIDMQILKPRIPPPFDPSDHFLK